MTPVEEDGPSLANGLPSPTSSPVANLDLAQRLSPTALSPASSPTVSDFATASRVANSTSTTSPIPIHAAGRMPGAWLSPYPDEVPSYEAVMSMSTPDLHGIATSSPLPSSPPLNALGSPRALSPSTGTPSTPASPCSHPSSPTPPSPDDAESPRRRFGFISLFHAHPHSHSHSHSYDRSARSRGNSVTGLPSQIPEGVTFDGVSPGSSPSVECPRPRLRSSRSVLDLLSRSWSDNHVVRSRSDRGF